MSIAHSVEVEQLEKLDISHHGVLSYSFAPAILMHVAVHPLDHDGLVVVQQLVPLDLVLTESHLQRPCAVIPRHGMTTVYLGHSFGHMPVGLHALEHDLNVVWQSVPLDLVLAEPHLWRP